MGGAEKTRNNALHGADLVAGRNALYDFVSRAGTTKTPASLKKIARAVQVRVCGLLEKLKNRKAKTTTEANWLKRMERSVRGG